jgi:zinc protease
MWGRPTRPENGCFLLRQMWRELSSLARDGITAGEFELTKSHLIGYVPELALSLDRQLGFAIDSLFYGIRGDYLKDLVAAISKIKHEQVNSVLKKHLKPENFRIVVTAADPDRFKKQLLSDECGITYAEGITKGEDVLKEDKIISQTKVPVEPERIRTLEAEALF